MKILLLNSRTGETFNRAQGFMLAHSIFFSDEVVTSSPSNDLILYYEKLPKLDGEEIFDWAKAFFGPNNDPNTLLDIIKGYDPQANGSFVKNWLFPPKQTKEIVSDKLKQQLSEQIRSLLERNGLFKLFPLLESEEGITLMPPAERCYDEDHNNHLLQEIIDIIMNPDSFLMLDFAADSQFTFYNYKKAFSYTSETDYMMSFPFLSIPSYNMMPANELELLKKDLKAHIYRQNTMLEDFKTYIQRKKFPDDLDKIRNYFTTNIAPQLEEIQAAVNKQPIHIKYRSLRIHRPVAYEIAVCSELSLPRYLKGIGVFKQHERRILRNTLTSHIGADHCLALVRLSSPEIYQRFRVKRDVPLKDEINL